MALYVIETIKKSGNIKLRKDSSFEFRSKIYTHFQMFVQRNRYFRL